VSAAALAVPFTVPTFTDEALVNAQKVLSSGWVTTGPECHSFEEELSSYLGQPHVVTLASCTHALELSLRALRLEPGAIVLTPALTFCGAVAAIIHAGLRAVLVDINEQTLTPDEQTVSAAVARVGRPAAMIVQTMAGYPVDSVALAQAAGLPNTRIVVDAAHGPGGTVGTCSAADAPFSTCLSFYATKNLPIGEGGAIATFDEEFAGWLRSARLHGMSRDAWKRYLPGGSWRYDVPEVGFKCNMTDLQASIGRAQLAALPSWQLRRAELFARYDEALLPLVESGDVVLPSRHPGHSYHLYQIRVAARDAVLDELTRSGIGTSVHFIPAHQLTGYAQELGAQECASAPVTDRVADELLSLPMYPALPDESVQLVCDQLKRILETRKADVLA
jgi:dTDP-4-amino-4,6-dideoxygalactose transaminase